MLKEDIYVLKEGIYVLLIFNKSTIFTIFIKSIKSVKNISVYIELLIFIFIYTYILKIYL